MASLRTTVVGQAQVAVASSLSRLDDPLEQLRAIRELKAKLVSLERGYAKDASYQYTWEEIGWAIGVSRQGAWRSYGAKRAKRPRRPKATTEK